MRISDLSIENFRGIRRGTIRFKTHTIITGPNNAGKTTIIEALALLVGRDRLVRELTEHDFTGADPQPADRLRLIATITGFDGNDPNAHHEWFRDGRAVPKWLDDTTGAVHPLRQNPAWLLCCQVGFQAYFDRAALCVETVRYFHDYDHLIDPFVEDVPVGVPTKLLQQVGFFLVRASRTWDGVLSFGSELFRRTVRAVDGQPAAAILTERDRLRHPDRPIEADPHLAPLVTRINAEIARFLPRGPTLKLRVTGTDSRAVLDAVVAHFSPAGAPPIPAARQGSGLLSLQGLLLLLQLGRARADDGEGFLMALEEPELHVPPASQRQLVHRIQALSTQTITTTHAPAVAAAGDPTALLLIRNDNGILAAEPLLTEALTAATPAWKRKLMQSGRPDVIAALMHDMVLIPEGRSDHELLRAVLCAVMLRQSWAEDGRRSFALEVGLVPTVDAQVVRTYGLLSRLHGRLCCLVDGDAAGRGYVRDLRAMAPPPAAILRWADGWTIEHVVGWLLEADEAATLDELSHLPNPPTSAADVVARLTEHKNDIVLYEAVGEAIADTPAGAMRAVELFAGMAAACAGQPTPLFGTEAPGVRVFQP